MCQIALRLHKKANELETIRNPSVSRQTCIASRTLHCLRSVSIRVYLNLTASWELDYACASEDALDEFFFFGGNFYFFDFFRYGRFFSISQDSRGLQSSGNCRQDMQFICGSSKNDCRW
jgi:hypothetical protein